MNKLEIRLSYKNCYILKRALRDKIIEKEESLEKLKTNPETKDECLYYLSQLGYSTDQANNTLKEFDEEYNKLFKELAEEKRALDEITEEIVNVTDKHGISQVKNNSD